MGDVDEKVRIQIKQDKKMEKQREIITARRCDYLPLFFSCEAGMDDHIAKPIHVDEPLLISKRNCNYSVATVKVLNSYEKFQTKRRVNFFTGFEKISQSFLSPYIM